MANGNPLFGLMPSVDPQQSAQMSMAAQAQQAMMQDPTAQNREYGLVTPQGMQPQTGPAPSGFGGPGGMQRLQQLYGAMAQTAEDPTALMQNYVTAMQQQQRLDELTSPMGRALSIYGKVNPHDWTADSLQRFHNNFRQTGQMQFDLLERKRAMTGETEKQIFDAHTKVEQAGTSAGRLGDIASRLADAHRRGEWTPGLPGRALTWWQQNVSGEYDTMASVKQDFRKEINQLVIDNLPPGVASDRDIQIARMGYPPEWADAAYLSSYIRGLQKIRVLETAFYRHKGMYLSANENPKGITGDWESRRDEFAQRALAAHGLQTNILDRQLTSHEQAREYFSRAAIDRAAATGQIAPANLTVGTPQMGGAEESTESFMAEFGPGR